MGPVCEICGCTEFDSCQVHGLACVWVRGHDGEPLCSACAPVEITAADPAGRIWLAQVIRAAALEQHAAYEPCNSLRMETRDQCSRYPFQQRRKHEDQE